MKLSLIKPLSAIIASLLMSIIFSLSQDVRANHSAQLQQQSALDQLVVLTKVISRIPFLEDVSLTDCLKDPVQS